MTGHLRSYNQCARCGRIVEGLLYCTECWEEREARRNLLDRALYGHPSVAWYECGQPDVLYIAGVAHPVTTDEHGEVIVTDELAAALREALGEAAKDGKGKTK